MTKFYSGITVYLQKDVYANLHKDYINTVSKNVKKCLCIIRLGNLLPHLLAFLLGAELVGFLKIARLGNYYLVFLEKKCLCLVLLP